MIPFIITTALVPAAVLAAIILEPHVEPWATRKRLQRSHRAATSPTVGTETEPHQPRVATSKSPVPSPKLDP